MTHKKLKVILVSVILSEGVLTLLLTWPGAALLMLVLVTMNIGVFGILALLISEAPKSKQLGVTKMANTLMLVSLLYSGTAICKCARLESKTHPTWHLMQSGQITPTEAVQIRNGYAERSRCLVVGTWTNINGVPWRHALVIYIWDPLRLLMEEGE